MAETTAIETTPAADENGRAAKASVASNLLRATHDVSRIEAPVTWQAYLICAFASFGGIFFGYDSGYINGTTGSTLFISMVEGPGQKSLSTPHSSLIVSILSAGTFFGAIIAGDVAERIGRKWTVIMGCLIYIIGVIVQMITGPEVDALGAIVAGRLIAGFGVGFESAIVILYMSEIVRTATVRIISSLPHSASMAAPSKSKLNVFMKPLDGKTNFYYSVPRVFVERSSPAINSALPSVFFWLLVSFTQPTVAMIPAPTVSQSPSNLPGALFLGVG